MKIPFVALVLVVSAVPAGNVSWSSATFINTDNLGTLSTIITQSPVTGQVGVYNAKSSPVSYTVNQGTAEQIDFVNVAPGATTPLHTVSGFTFTWVSGGQSGSVIAPTIDWVYVLPSPAESGLFATYAFELTAPDGTQYITTWAAGQPTQPTNAATVSSYLVWPMPFFNLTVTNMLRSYNYTSGVYAPIIKQGNTVVTFQIRSFITGLSVTTDYKISVQFSGQFSTKEPYEVFFVKNNRGEAVGTTYADANTALYTHLQPGVVASLGIEPGDNVTVRVLDAFQRTVSFTSGAVNYFTYTAPWTPSPPFYFDTPSPGHKLGTGAIIGIAAGGAVFVAAIVGTGLVFGLRRRKRNYDQIQEPRNLLTN